MSTSARAGTPSTKCARAVIPPPMSCPTSTASVTPQCSTSSASARACRAIVGRTPGSALESPNPSRSHTWTRCVAASAGTTERHRNDQAGVPCVSTTGGPSPTTPAATSPSVSRTRSGRCQPSVVVMSIPPPPYADIVVRQLTTLLVSCCEVHVRRAGAPSADRRSRRHHAGGARLRRRVGGPHRPADRDQPTADPLPLPQPRGTDRGRPRSHLRGRLRGGPAEHRPGGHRAGTAGGVHHRQRRLLSGASRLHPRARGDRARHPRRRLATGSSPGGSPDRRARHRPSSRARGRRARLLRRHRHGPHRPPRAQRSARRLAPGPRARPRPLHRRAAAAVPGRDHEGRGHMMMSVDRAERTTTGNRKAAWSLVVITPLAAELTFGSTPLRMAYLVLLWVPIYGAGVLLIRELVRRAGRGWPSILLLGIAYGMLEDGIGLQALTSPRLYDAAEWGMRVGGVNLAYWEATAIYHTVFSVAIPIALTELLFSSHGRRPYLRTGGLVLTATVTA